jgi:hypothetical protein
MYYYGTPCFMVDHWSREVTEGIRCPDYLSCVKSERYPESDGEGIYPCSSEWHNEGENA